MIPNKPLIPRADMIRCALCEDAPCDQACDRVKPASLLRSVWFTNEQCAAQRLPAENPCLLHARLPARLKPPFLRSTIRRI